MYGNRKEAYWLSAPLPAPTLVCFCCPSWLITLHISISSYSCFVDHLPSTHTSDDLLQPIHHLNLTS